jgi:hypothetical protein
MVLPCATTVTSACARAAKASGLGDGAGLAAGAPAGIPKHASAAAHMNSRRKKVPIDALLGFLARLTYVRAGGRDASVR